MPNHITNTVTISHADPKKKQWLKKCFITEKGQTEKCLDFNRIIPMPKNIFRGDLGEAQRAMCLREGRPNWYDWCIKHWGTKWGAYSCSILSETKTTIECQFDTAWSPPTPIYDKLRAMGFTLEGTWVDEGDEDNVVEI